MALTLDNPLLQRAVAAGPVLVAALLLALLAWRLAELTWLALPMRVEPPPPALPSSGGSATVRATPVNITSISRLHLFGQPAAQTVTATPPPRATESAPVTKLRIKLSGIMVSESGAGSLAIIEGSDKKQKVYGVGDEVAQNTELHEVHELHVVLLRNGRYETLHLEQVSSTNKVAPVARGLTAGDPNASIGTELRSLREQILRNPEKASEMIRVQPVYSKGKLSGYRVYPGKDRKLFRKVGLRSGDLVTTLNGQILDDPAKGFSILSQLSTADVINVTVKRRGRDQNLTLDLNQ